MTRAEIEEKVIALIHQEPFVPFRVELTNGDVLIVPHPRLAVNRSGAGFIGPEGGLVDIDFSQVRGIEALGEKVAL